MIHTSSPKSRVGAYKIPEFQAKNVMLWVAAENLGFVGDGTKLEMGHLEELLIT